MAKLSSAAAAATRQEVTNSSLCALVVIKLAIKHRDRAAMIEAAMRGRAERMAKILAS